MRSLLPLILACHLMAAWPVRTADSEHEERHYLRYANFGHRGASDTPPAGLIMMWNRRPARPNPQVRRTCVSGAHLTCKLWSLPALRRAAGEAARSGRARRRSSSVRQSKRLIIAVSPVQVRPPLRARRPLRWAHDGRWRRRPEYWSRFRHYARTTGCSPVPRACPRGFVLEKGTPSWLPPT